MPLFNVLDVVLSRAHEGPLLLRALQHGGRVVGISIRRHLGKLRGAARAEDTAAEECSAEVVSVTFSDGYEQGDQVSKRAGARGVNAQTAGNCGVGVQLRMG